MLAIFYHIQEQPMVAEGLFRRALDLSENEKSANRVFVQRMFGHILKYNKNRSTESENLIKEAEELEKSLPKSATKLQSIMLL